MAAPEGVHLPPANCSRTRRPARPGAGVTVSNRAILRSGTQSRRPRRGRPSAVQLTRVRLRPWRALREGGTRPVRRRCPSGLPTTARSSAAAISRSGSPYSCVMTNVAAWSGSNEAAKRARHGRPAQPDQYPMPWRAGSHRSVRTARAADSGRGPGNAGRMPNPQPLGSDQPVAPVRASTSSARIHPNPRPHSGATASGSERSWHGCGHTLHGEHRYQDQQGVHECDHHTGPCCG
jgi:hypothetical protein